MKTNLKMAVALAALTLLAGSANITMAQMVGGYRKVEVTDEYARAAAEWAVREKMDKTGTAIELLSLVQAERQTVQGANYRLCMQINAEGEDENTVTHVKAVVYMDLKKNYKLTGWTANSDCAKPGASTAAKPIQVGGYRAILKTDPNAVAAANFAITAQSTKTGYTFELLDLVKAERQVVAGSNYKLCMQVSVDGDEPFFVQAVVYVDLKNNRKLTSWADSDCGDQ
jgi:P2-related tail formation protein